MSPFSVSVILLVGLCLTTQAFPGTNDNREERGVIADKIAEGMSKLFHHAGILECNGLDSMTGGTFFHRIFGDRPSLGNSLCGPTCGGQCVAYTGLANAPSSVSYAFGCNCPAQRCGMRGPVASPLADPSIRIECQPDPTCSCAGMGFNHFGGFTNTMGYLCNWVKLDHMRVTFQDLGQHSFLKSVSSVPVSWCSCCPSS